MRDVEKTNKGLFDQLVAKQKQVRSFIQQVKKGKITYTDDQFAQITTLASTLTTDMQVIKADGATIKTSVDSEKKQFKGKDYTTAIVTLTAELAIRQARGAAIVKASADLDSIIVILVQGTAVENTPVVPTAPIVTN